MNEQDLKNIWQSASNKDRVNFNSKELVENLETEVAAFQKSIRQRDNREIGVAILMIPFFGITAYLIPFIISKIGALIIIGGAALIIYRITKAKKTINLTSEGSYLSYLTQAIEFLTAQKKLLSSVLYWYILPFLSGVLLFLMGFNTPTIQKAIHIIIVLVIGLSIFYLNKMAIKQEITPRINRINSILKNLNEIN